MQLLRPVFALCLFATLASHAAVVYKWTDADGVVHFSDQPVEGAERITVSGESLNRSAAPGVTPPAGNLRGMLDKANSSKPGPHYLSFVISTPVKEQTFFDEPVPVSVVIDPPLDDGHALNWSLNGQVLADQQNRMAFQLTDLPRGTYVLSATITDLGTHEQTSSSPVTFFMHQHSVAAPHK
jgi:hypothetical protein